MTSVDVEGFEELDRALAGLPEALRRNVVLAALRKAAQPMVREAKTRARRGSDPKRRGSQKQRKSGESERIGHGADSITARAVRTDRPNEAAVALGPDAKHWYMRFVEFGTSRQAADRFMTAAFEIHKERAVELVGEELWKSLSRTAARLAKQADAGTLSKKARRALESR